MQGNFIATPSDATSSEAFLRSVIVCKACKLTIALSQSLPSWRARGKVPDSDGFGRRAANGISTFLSCKTGPRFLTSPPALTFKSEVVVN